MNTSIKSNAGRKLLAIALTATLVLGLLPTFAPMTASAASIGTTLTLTNVSDTTHPEDGYTWDYVAGGTSTLTLSNLNLNASDGNGINFNNTVTGAVKIVLIGTNNVTGADRGIYAQSASLLTISGSGTLNATATDTYGSGIYANSGDITINSGTVNATGGTGGTGIYAYVHSSSDIIISGGIVNASGNIGINAGNSILISGGTVNAVGSYDGTNSYQSTTINGDAIVKATGGNKAMNIYSGSSVFGTKGILFENGTGTVYGNVTLPGDLTVTSGETLTVPGDAILTIPSGTTLTNDGTITNDGTLTNSGMINNVGTLTNNGTWAGASPIYSSTLTLTNTNASGIGYDWDGTTLTLTDFMLDASNNYGIVFDQTVTGAVQIVLNGTSKVTGDGIRRIGATSSLTITGPGTLTTEGGYIGIMAGNIEISGGTVTANGSDYGIYAVSNIEINGGTVTAEGGDYGIMAINSIKINGGTVNAEGGLFGIVTDNNIEVSGDTIVKASGASVNEAIESSYGSAYVRIDKGVVFKNGVGTVFGDVALTGDLTIASGETLTIPSGSSLTIPNGKTITNDGTLTNNSAIKNGGTVNNNGTINGNTVIINTGTGTIIGTGSILYTVTLKNLTANGAANITDTTQLTLTFSADPTTLKVGNITVTGATKGALTGTGTIRTLAISNITVGEGQNVTVAIANPAGFSITPTSKTVAIHKAQPIPDPSITGVSINGASKTQHYFKADGSSKTLNLSVSVIGTAINKAVSWSSNNAGIASINESGVVTFTGKEGAVIIKATSKHDTNKYDIKTITVCKNVTKIRTPLTKVNITKGKSLTLPIELDDGNITVTKNAGMTFTSNNKKVVTVDPKTGKIKGIKQGKANITVTTANGKSLIIKVNVGKKSVKLKKFTLTGVKKNALSLKVGKTKDLKIKLAGSKASDLKITFKSSKPSVLKVDKAGRLFAVKKGKATITVKASGKKVKVKVTVK
jgi:hypothetical protein